MVAIAGGTGGTVYALKSDGTVWAWGYGGNGLLGNGTTANSSVPVRVRGLAHVTAIAAGWATAFGLKADGTVWAWGWGGYHTYTAGMPGNGLLGNGKIGGSSDVPVKVRRLDHVTAIAVGAYNAYALKSNGTVWAWGANRVGELGNGKIGGYSDVPVEVHGLSGSPSSPPVTVNGTPPGTGVPSGSEYPYHPE